MHHGSIIERPCLTDERSETPLPSSLPPSLFSSPFVFKNKRNSFQFKNPRLAGALVQVAAQLEEGVLAGAREGGREGGRGG